MTTVGVHSAIAENLTLTAEWVKNVTVTFDTDGGSTIDPAPYTDKTPGTELVAPADPTKEGYTFLDAPST